jgi:hypothetical protein
MLKMTPLKLKLKRRLLDLQSHLRRHNLVLVKLMFAINGDVIDIKACLIPKRNSSLDNEIKERANSAALDLGRGGEEFYNENISVVPTPYLGQYSLTAQLDPGYTVPIPCFKRSIYTEGEIQIRPRYNGEIGFTLRRYVRQLQQQQQPLIRELGGFLISVHKVANLQPNIMDELRR